MKIVGAAIHDITFNPELDEVVKFTKKKYPAGAHLSENPKRKQKLMKSLELGFC